LLRPNAINSAVLALKHDIFGAISDRIHVSRRTADGVASAHGERSAHDDDGGNLMQHDFSPAYG
jgi:hypothetical protein